MSRCFPFPPPGYMRRGTCNEAVIKPIELQRERQKEGEKTKKERKKEKEVKRRERKETKPKLGKARNACLGEENLFKPNVVEYHQLEKVRAESGRGCLQKLDDDENEQLERSGITEEHEQPVSSWEPCCSSDSTQRSNKRKRITSPSSHDHRTVIRIRLPLRKHREPEESQHDDQLGSSSGSLKRDCQPQFVIKAETYQCAGNPDSEQCKGLQRFTLETADVQVSTNLIDNENPKLASAYDSLFYNWVPPPLTFEGAESCDWLFRTRLRAERPVSKEVKYADNFWRSIPSLCQRAQYIPQHEIFALPYTVPF